ncbi:response regulator [Candidatus Saccharibacteria bacterium]|nr:response regulator [Candidatus Saccharibacteria bacterium]
MAKILLVEDDSNLREIYGARLEAEGYEILTANDGEEALAIAVKEKPNLIITDVMMPKISGFDMLDILRTTPETKDVKVIVMTALSQDDDRKRGTDLGVDQYIVKSQVTLDDVVTIVKEALGDAPQSAPVSNAPASDDAQQAQASDSPEDVEDFVANSPLMNGTPPAPSTDSQPQEPPKEQ